MLAIVYLALMIAVGDAIGRRFMPFLSAPHRWASAFLCGLLFSSWFTYLVALASAGSSTPMFSGNLAFFVAAGGLVYFLNRGGSNASTTLDTGESVFKRWDWAFVGCFLVFAWWMMFRTFTMTDDNISFGHHQFPDFGSTVSIMQSFALGHNFPTEYPHFSGERIRYHFLFYFQAGNFEYLGLNPAWANNLLSILSLTSLLVLVMTLGSLIFRSRVAGRIGAVLFFFQGSLAFIPFLVANPSFSAVMDKLSKMTMYLNSGLPYRGEDWGVWSQNVFLNQRHFTSSIALFLLVVIFLFIRYREKLEPVPVIEASADLQAEASGQAELSVEAAVEDGPEPDSETGSELTEETPGEDIEDAESEPADQEEESATSPQTPVIENAARFGQYPAFIFCGLILGLLPLWNGPVYLSAALVLAVCFLLFPLKKEMIALAATAGVVGLPQVIFLTTGSLREPGYSMFRWGFVIDNAGFFDVLYYIFFTFGFKWVLLAIALYFASGLQRRFLAAIFILFPLTFCFRFSEEVLANHKFLNVWLVIANVYVGYALVKLWGLKAGSTTIPSRIAAVVLTILITIGGAIDLVPVWNSYFIHMKYKDDDLIEWAKANTEPSAIFLSHRYINHQILLAGRKLFFGDPYYAWGAGYDTTKRETLVRNLFEMRDPAEFYRLLKENNIGYIAVDDMVRSSKVFIQNPNEDMIAKYFPQVFNDDKKQYANIKIYKVPASLNVPVSDSPSLSDPASVPVANGFKGGEGSGPGQFSRPRGITLDQSGNIYVADTGNSRIQKFDASGTYLSSIGAKGSAPGQLIAPNGVAVDAAGNVYVTDADQHKLVRFRPDGTFDKEWTGPQDRFYGPRDLIFGPNKMLYIIDQGGTRIAKFDPAAETFQTWGSAGNGESQFSEPTGIEIGDGMIFVADAGNGRIQVFDLEGRFGRQFEIPSWERFGGHYPDIAFDAASKTLYVSNGKTNEILGYKPDGTQTTGFKPEGEARLNNPCSLAIQTVGGKRHLLVLNTGVAGITTFDLGSKKTK